MEIGLDGWNGMEACMDAPETRLSRDSYRSGDKAEGPLALYSFRETLVRGWIYPG